MSSTGPASTVLHLPDEVAVMLRCSAWWVKDQARKGRIPHCRIGGGYRFTDAHIAEIIRQHEVRPEQTPIPAPAGRRIRATEPVGEQRNEGAAVIRLVARTPKRARAVVSDVAA